MKKILLTGANGFIGKNLMMGLLQRQDICVKPFDAEDSLEVLESYILEADFIFHLAGVNRPQNTAEFETGNAGLTQTVTELLKKHNKNTPVVMTSSIQAVLDNPYGLSKKKAEEVLFAYGQETGAPVFVYRLPNVFGKWCRPNYNSVVATFCCNIAHGLPVQINDPGYVLSLVYIDDVVREFTAVLDGNVSPDEKGCLCMPRIFHISLQDLADLIRSFRESRKTLVLPDFEDDLTKYLYATYLSYLEENDFGYPLEMKQDQRGWLAELLKSNQFGQIFISRTRPGVTRGNHWHHTKVEKFVVVEGEAVIRFRQLHGSKVLEYRVSGEKIEVLDIPPGYTHSIQNTGNTDVLTLFWASEIFNPDKPDTYFLEV